MMTTKPEEDSFHFLYPLTPRMGMRDNSSKNHFDMAVGEGESCVTSNTHTCIIRTGIVRIGNSDYHHSPLPQRENNGGRGYNFISLSLIRGGRGGKEIMLT